MTLISLVPPIYINVKQYGALGDGSTDDTTAIALALSAATSAGGGVVFFPPGTYITTGQTIYPNVVVQGSGWGATTIKLKSGANTDLFGAYQSSINLSGVSGSGPGTAVYNFGFTDITLDGNCSGQSAGPSYVLRFYGYGFLLQNIHIFRGYSGGAQWDYYGPFPANHSLELQLETFQFMDNQGIGLEVGGPSDGIWSNGTIAQNFNSGSHNVHICQNGGGVQASNVHMWRPTPFNSSVNLLVEGTASFVNCEAEGSDTCNIVLLADRFSWYGGRIFQGGKNGQGIQIGQTAGGTPYAGSLNQSGGLTTSVASSKYSIKTLFHDLTNIALNFANDGGGVIDSVVYQTSSQATIGTINTNTMAIIKVYGLTSDGTVPFGGCFQIPVDGNTGFFVSKGTGNSIYFSVNTHSGAQKSVDLPNNAALWMYSDNFVTKTLQLQAGTIVPYPSVTSPDPGNAGTITTSGVGIARITPTSNETGGILQAGTLNGQQVIVLNESATNSFTFAASGTSNVAAGTGASIAANTKQTYYWDAAKGLWY